MNSEGRVWLLMWVGLTGADVALAGLGSRLSSHSWPVGFGLAAVSAGLACAGQKWPRLGWLRWWAGTAAILLTAAGMLVARTNHLMSVVK
jgi:hypothetical protein